jgi:hypothetical protein
MIRQILIRKGKGLIFAGNNLKILKLVGQPFSTPKKPDGNV